MTGQVGRPAGRRDGLAKRLDGPAGRRDGGIALILAAGSGRRLGLGPKALLPWAGSVLVVRAVRAARKAGLSVVVTAGPQFDAIASHLAEAGLEEPSVTLVEVPDASIGMSASFRAGVAAIGSAPEETPVAMMLVDQPGVGSAVLTRLRSCFDPNRVVRASWSGAPGHPVVMSRRHAQDAAAGASGDEAGRSWMRDHSLLVDAVECADLGSGADIDTPADLDEAVAAARSRDGDPLRSRQSVPDLRPSDPDLSSAREARGSRRRL